MKDPIERADAIDALADYIHNVDKVIGTGHLSADDCKDAATSVLEDIPSAQYVDCFKCIFRGSPGFKQFQPKTEDRTAESVQNVSDDDLISRKAAIDSVCEYCEYYYNENVIQSIKEIPSAQQWIPCSERLPEEYGDYLVTMELTGWNLETYRTIDVAYFDTGWHIADMVLAWMPLPEPYKGR